MNAKDASAKVISSLHRAAYRASKGKVGGTGFGMPVVILETTGRKSGAIRETMLTSPIVDDDGDLVVLIASYGGDDRHPAWYHNLSANPDVHLTLDGRKRAMTARTATPEEKEDLWPRVVLAYRGYAQYQTRTERDIPVVLLTPR